MGNDSVGLGLGFAAEADGAYCRFSAALVL
jgi:hypothetical protein